LEEGAKFPFALEPKNSLGGPVYITDNGKKKIDGNKYVDIKFSAHDAFLE